MGRGTLMTLALAVALLAQTAVAGDESCSSLSVPMMLCRDYPDPPDIAVCLGGSARTLVNQLVHQSLRDNVLHAFGAPTTLFAYLKTKDNRGDERHADADAGLLNRVLSRLGALSTHVDIHAASEKLEPPRCSNYETFPADQMEYQASFIAQLQFRHGCHALIAADERLRGRNYSWVLYSRPDLAWYRPVPPWCTIRRAVEAGVKRQDWTFLLSRGDADAAMQRPFEDYFGCRVPFNLQDGIEGWDGDHAFPGRTQRWNALARELGDKPTDNPRRDTYILPAFLVRHPFNVTRSSMCDCHKYNGLAGATDVTQPSTSNWCRQLNDDNSCNRPDPDE
jgi:hypothetical protein